MARGSNVELTRENPSLRSVVVGVDIDAGRERVVQQNFVIAAILCRADGQAQGAQDFVYANQLSSPDLSVAALAEAMGSDDEQIEIDLGEVPGEVEKIVIAGFLNEGPGAKRTLGQLRGCVVRVLNLQGNSELVRSEDMAPAFGSETAVALAEVYRHRDQWKFRVIGQGYAKGIAALTRDYGITL